MIEEKSKFEMSPSEFQQMFMHRYNYPTERYGICFNFETSGRYRQAVNGTGATITFDTGPLTLETGTTTTGNALVKMDAWDVDWSYDVYDRYPMIHTAISIIDHTAAQTADSYIVFGLVDPATPSYVKKHFGFKIAGSNASKLYATSSDGTTQKTTDITPVGWDETEHTTLRAILIPKKGISFWVNGAFATQHFSNFPSGELELGTNPIASVSMRATAGEATKYLLVGPTTVSYYDF